jgi:hypothetical protein
MAMAMPSVEFVTCLKGTCLLSCKERAAYRIGLAALEVITPMAAGGNLSGLGRSMAK